jgi:hypothetical protein
VRIYRVTDMLPPAASERFAERMLARVGTLAANY